MSIPYATRSRRRRLTPSLPAGTAPGAPAHRGVEPPRGTAGR
ncbi:hypothetical protein QJS66_14155 [Kocuria rhizophila]|nr:hypothetical protein QJS66_14155 [Kocuria rhizophila]